VNQEASPEQLGDLLAAQTAAASRGNDASSVLAFLRGSVSSSGVVPGGAYSSEKPEA
jgi:hypothetical protein